MNNASGNGTPTLHHEEWCDPTEHARTIRDELGDYCVGRMLTQPIKEDQAEIDGWWHAHDDGLPEPQFCLDGVSDFTAVNLRALDWYLVGASTARAVALRAIIARALAELRP